MSWCYITPEQGAAVDRICEQFRTGFKEGDCPDCPLRSVCKDMELPDGTTEEATHERTRIFEDALSEAAEAYTSREENGHGMDL